ncbi:MAG: DUF1846 domain-containing protein, partial [Methanomassiliicoccaceae archaeon]|nr:DUF1846 domain-containing protein [Methanomassiliicoccaceae archaeon]
VVNADDIAKNKARGDTGITYDMEALRLLDSFRERGMAADSIVLTQYSSQPAAVIFEKRLKALNIKVYRHYSIEGYPLEIEKIVNDKGFGKNDHIKTTKPLVVVTSPGPGSGKMATCLSQLYHDNKKGVPAGYAKFETFPIWNIPLDHPVNVAYEAATIDLGDENMIDPFHLKAYGIQTVNYNRDIEIFPVLNSILESILGESPYKSPTDMSVNMAGYCITNEEIVAKASRLEVIRRYYDVLKERKQGNASDDMVARMELLMKNASITTNERKVISVVMKRAIELNKNNPGLEAIAVSGTELEDGTIITGKTSTLLGASSAMILNALKTIAGLDDSVLLISPKVLQPIQFLKTENLGFRNTKLHVDEMLIALSISALTDPLAKEALDQLPKLKGCEMHSSVILSSVEESTLKRLGFYITCEPVYQNNALYQGQRKN